MILDRDGKIILFLLGIVIILVVLLLNKNKNKIPISDISNDTKQMIGQLDSLRLIVLENDKKDSIQLATYSHSMDSVNALLDFESNKNNRLYGDIEDLKQRYKEEFDVELPHPNSYDFSEVQNTDN